MGRILAIEFKRNQQAPNNFLPILLVNSIVQKTQTTVLWGQSLLGATTANLGPVWYFQNLLAEWSNKPKLWAEMSQINPNINNFPSDYQLLPQLPPVQPIAVKTATLLATGVDPLRGYWMEFAGNYNLYFGLFQGDWYNTTGTVQGLGH